MVKTYRGCGDHNIKVNVGTSGLKCGLNVKKWNPNFTRGEVEQSHQERHRSLEPFLKVIETK